MKRVDGQRAALRAVKDTKGDGHTGAMTVGIVGESILFSPTPALANLFPLGPSPKSISTNYSTSM
jgi:hypothetical protein